MVAVERNVCNTQRIDWAQKPQMSSDESDLRTFADQLEQTCEQFTATPLTEVIVTKIDQNHNEVP